MKKRSILIVMALVLGYIIAMDVLSSSFTTIYVEDNTGGVADLYIDNKFVENITMKINENKWTGGTDIDLKGLIHTLKIVKGNKSLEYGWYWAGWGYLKFDFIDMKTEFHHF